MFQKAKNIDTAFRQVRLFTLVIVVLCFAFSSYIYQRSQSQMGAMQQKVYILANGKALEAFAADRKDNVPVEARDHVQVFHHYFFTQDPDEKVITANMTKALYLADGTARREYDNLRENGYYAGIISGNISQRITADSVVVNMETHPYRFRYYGTQHIVRSTRQMTRSLITEGYLRNVSRSDNNPHGFLIERWTTIDNKDIKTENR